MNYGQIPGIEKPVSRLIQGTVPLDVNDLASSFALLDGVYEAGCRAFDTAHVYNGGDAERIFGRWLAERVNREEVVILSKGAHHNSDRRRVTAFDIQSDLHDSLARMQVDYVDLYLLHRDDPSKPIGPIVDALNSLAEQGLIRAYGGSNWTHERIAEANAYANEHGLRPFIASSPQFSLAEQIKEPWPKCVTLTGEANKAARDWYEETQLAVLPWSSAAAGFFSGKITRENASQQTDYFLKLSAECYGSGANYERAERAHEVGQKHGVSAAQIALAWVFAQPMNLFPIVGCRTVAEFQQNAAVLDLELGADEVRYLNGE
jgi:aryl-alcohol dehydrogenase-like predicted oxidoreductase